MKFAIIAAAGLCAAALPAQAALVFSDNFDAEGATVLNYTGFAQWDVVGGTVDLIGTPNSYNIRCVGNTGSCVDMDGTSGASGTLITKQLFTVAAGEFITLQFDLSGNQRRPPSDVALFGFQFVGPPPYDGDAPLGTFTYDQNFVTFTAAGSYPSTQAFKLYFRNAGGDNEGVILDNVKMYVGGVPEPTTWAMLIAGFGLIGGAMRNRKRMSATYA